MVLKPFLPWDAGRHSRGSCVDSIIWSLVRSNLRGLSAMTVLNRGLTCGEVIFNSIFSTEKLGVTTRSIVVNNLRGSSSRLLRRSQILLTWESSCMLIVNLGQSLCLVGRNTFWLQVLILTSSIWWRLLGYCLNFLRSRATRYRWTGTRWWFFRTAHRTRYWTSGQYDIVVIRGLMMVLLK